MGVRGPYKNRGKVLVNLAGQVIGNLTVIEHAGFSDADVRRRSFWRCRCSCGKETVVEHGNLRKGHTQSCGCIAIHSVRTRSMTHGHVLGRRPTKTYSTWQSMLTRCYYPKIRCYPNYGGRGITVCKQWHSFENFLEDMGERPEGFTLDRINNDGDYSKENCRWATQVQQQRNKRNNRLSELLARQIREIRSTGVSHDKLAVQFGVSKQSIYGVCKNKTWA